MMGIVVLSKEIIVQRCEDMLTAEARKSKCRGAAAAQGMRKGDPVLRRAC
jgi:hypothetical protein